MKSLLHTGASGTVGAAAVATGPRDGYTFLVAANASIAINPAPAEFAADLARERARWASFVKRNGITVDQ